MREGRAMELVDEDVTQAGDELLAAAEEASEMMVWVLGGFDRELSDKERQNNALPRYHASRERLHGAIEGWKQARGGNHANG